jgi:hypothetical protein
LPTPVPFGMQNSGSPRLSGDLILLTGSSFLLYWSRTPLKMAGIYLLFGMMLSSVGMGPIIRSEGFRVGFFLNGATGVLVLVLFRFLYRRQKV